MPAYILAPFGLPDVDRVLLCCGYRHVEGISMQLFSTYIPYMILQLLTIWCSRSTNIDFMF